MSLQQRDCPGLPPDSLFIRRPERIHPMGLAEQNRCKGIKNTFSGQLFFDLNQEKACSRTTKPAKA